MKMVPKNQTERSHVPSETALPSVLIHHLFYFFLHSNWVLFMLPFSPTVFIEPRFITKAKHSLHKLFWNNQMGEWVFMKPLHYSSCLSLLVQEFLLYEVVPLERTLLPLCLIDLLASKLPGKAFPFLLPLGPVGWRFFIVINSNSVAIFHTEEFQNSHALNYFCLLKLTHSSVSVWIYFWTS